MSIVKKVIGMALYTCIGKHLPVSYCRVGGKAAKAFRALCGRLILNRCGQDVNIERGAVFAHTVAYPAPSTAFSASRVVLPSTETAVMRA